MGVKLEIMKLSPNVPSEAESAGCDLIAWQASRFPLRLWSAHWSVLPGVPWLQANSLWRPGSQICCSVSTQSWRGEDGAHTWLTRCCSVTWVATRELTVLIRICKPFVQWDWTEWFHCNTKGLRSLDWTELSEERQLLARNFVKNNTKHLSVGLGLLPPPLPHSLSPPSPFLSGASLNKTN